MVARMKAGSSSAMMRATSPRRRSLGFAEISCLTQDELNLIRIFDPKRQFLDKK